MARVVLHMPSIVTPLTEHRDHPTLGVLTFIGNLLLMALVSAMVKTCRRTIHSARYCCSDSRLRLYFSG